MHCGLPRRPRRSPESGKTFEGASEPSRLPFSFEDGTSPRAATRGTTAAEVSSEKSQAKDLRRSPKDLDGGGYIFSSQELHRISEIQRQSVLQPSFCNIKEVGETHTCLRPDEIERKRIGMQLQDEVPSIHLQADTHKRLHDLTGSGGYIYAHHNPHVLKEVLAVLLELFSIPVQGKPVRSIPQPSHVYQGAPSDIGIYQSTQHTNISLPERYTNHWRIEGNLQTKYRSIFFQTNGKREHEPQGLIIQGQRPMPRSEEAFESWIDDFEIPGELHRENTGFFSSSTTWKINSETTIRPEECCTVCIEDMDVDSETYRA
ncbi:hypothetical protein AYI68_g514 [Smittium mucronatum]|uniref:Uncharacterized protein n=1 Tax=Smittium mucronatum TaxID=133383 RepID=A0A1R0H875_9FUNG|nr:hypothetical protein AYI68_g514 [Smittium mucronatum]